MDDDAIKKIIEEAQQLPSQPLGIMWDMALAVFMLRELDERMPGFKAAIRSRVLAAADRIAGSDPQDQADVESLSELAKSWVFEEPPS